MDLETSFAGQIVLFDLGCANTLDSSIDCNRNFNNILRTKLRRMKLPGGSKTVARVRAKCMMGFENRIKMNFSNSGQKWAIDVGIEAEFPEADIEAGYMTFTNDEIFQCFEPVVNRILELIRDQVIEIQAQNCMLKVCPQIFSKFGTSLIHL